MSFRRCLCSTDSSAGNCTFIFMRKASRREISEQTSKGRFRVAERRNSLPTSNERTKLNAADSWGPMLDFRVFSD